MAQGQLQVFSQLSKLRLTNQAEKEYGRKGRRWGKARGGPGKIYPVRVRKDCWWVETQFEGSNNISEHYTVMNRSLALFISANSSSSGLVNSHVLNGSFLVFIKCTSKQLWISRRLWTEDLVINGTICEYIQMSEGQDTWYCSNIESPWNYLLVAPWRPT